MLRREEFEKLQELARLRLTEAEASALLPQLEKILDYVHTLQGLDLDDVPAFGHSSDSGVRVREDEPAFGLSRGEALASAPDSQEALFRVPRVLPPGEKP